MPLHPIILEEWELLNLDHRCSPKTQILINQIKDRTPHISPLDRFVPKQVESLPGQQKLFE